jgi:predicted membrane metal-binding protein
MPWKRVLRLEHRSLILILILVLVLILNLAPFLIQDPGLPA